VKKIKKKSLDYSHIWDKNIPNTKLVMIERGERVPFVGNKKQFHQELLKWLKDECQLNNRGIDTESKSSNDVNIEQEYGNLANDIDFDNDNDGDGTFSDVNRGYDDENTKAMSDNQDNKLEQLDVDKNVEDITDDDLSDLDMEKKETDDLVEEQEFDDAVQ